MTEENQTPDAHRGEGPASDNSQSGMPKRKTHLLVFAAGKYSHWDNLDYPVHECRKLIDVLVKKYQVEHDSKRYFFDEEVSYNNIITQVFSITDEFQKDENLIIIFSGHGYFIKELDKGYWVPSEAPLPKGRVVFDPEIERNCISATLLAELINARCTCHHLLLIVDSCFPGAFGRISVDVPGVIAAYQGAKPEDIPCRLALLSGLFEKTNAKSPFAEALLKVLEENERKELRIGLLYEQLLDALPPETKQSPHLENLTDKEPIIGGRFVFFRREAEHITHDFLIQEKGLEKIDLTRLEKTLFSGSSTHCQNLEKSRFRFSIIEALLPGWKDSMFDIWVEPAKDIEQVEKNLSKAILAARKNTSNPHLLVIGDGGAGKTVSLLHLWKTFTNESSLENPVPLFVPLNEYNVAPPDKRREFVLFYLAKHYLDEHDPSDALKTALYDLFKTQQEGRPRFLLLLDGFNEVTVQDNELLVELGTLREKCPGLQIVATSRPDRPMESFTWAADFEKIALVPVNEGRIRSYLWDRKLPAPADAGMFELLGNPMMLTIYAGCSELREEAVTSGSTFFEFKPHNNSKGELLWNFAEAQIYKFHRDNREDQDGLIWTSFLLRYLAPFIAYRMVHAGQFYLTVLPEPLIRRFTDLADEAYVWFDQMNLAALLPEFGTKSDLFHRLGIIANHQDIEARSLALRADLVTRLNILVREGNTLRFQHQHFRDYFAARHVLNDISLSLKANVFPGSMQVAPLDFYVSQLLSEMEGEHHNSLQRYGKAWRWSAGQFALDNRLTELLNWCRGKFDQEQVGYTVYNLLAIYIKARGEHLRGADLSRLDLRKVTLNSKNLESLQVPSIKTVLDQSIVNKETLFSAGHISIINDVFFLGDSDHFLTVSSDKTVKIWEVSTEQCLFTIGSHSDDVIGADYDPGVQNDRFRTTKSDNAVCADYHSGKKLIATASEDGTIKIWAWPAKKCIHRIKGENDSGYRNIGFNPSGDLILADTYDKTHVFDIESEKLNCTLGGGGSFESGEKSLQTRFHPINSDLFLTYPYSSEENPKIWNIETGECILELLIPKGNELVYSTRENIHKAVFSIDGKFIATASNNGTACIWDAENGKLLRILKHKNRVWGVQFHPDSTKLLSWSDDKTAKVWDIQSGNLLFNLEGHSGAVFGACFNHDGSLILTREEGRNGKVIIWEIGNLCEPVRSFKHVASVSHAIFNFKENLLLVLDNEDNSFVWDIKTEVLLTRIKPGLSDILFTGKHPGFDFIFILSGKSENYILNIWDINMGICKYVIHGYPNYSIKLSKAYSRLVAIYTKSTTSDINEFVPQLWDIRTGEVISTLQETMESIRNFDLSPCGKYFITIDSDNYFRLWDTLNGRFLSKITLNSVPEQGSALFGPDDEYLFVLMQDKVSFWRLPTCEHLFDFNSVRTSIVRSKMHHPLKTQILFELEGSHLMLLDYFDKNGAKILYDIPHQEDWITSGTFNKTGSLFITGHRNGNVKIWNAETGEVLHFLKDTYERHFNRPTHDYEIKWVKFNYDGTVALSYASEGERAIKIWLAISGEFLGEISGKYFHIEFHPGKNHLMLGNYRNSVKVWEILNNEVKLLYYLGGESAAFTSANYTDDGAYIITTEMARVTRLWDAATGAEIKSFPSTPGLFLSGCSMRNLHAGSNLSAEDKALLRRYGAIFNEEDQVVWDRLMGTEG